MRKLLLIFILVCFSALSFGLSLEKADQILLKAQSTQDPEKKEQLFEQAGLAYLELLKNGEAEVYLVAERIGEYYYFKYQVEKNNSKKEDYLKKSIKSLNLAIKKKKNFALPYAKLGEIYALLNDFDLARLNYESAVKYDNKNYVYRLGLAFSYSRRNYFNEAIKIYEAAIQDFPKQDVRLYLNLADVYRRAEGEKNFKKALNILNKIETVQPAYTEQYEKYAFHDKGLNYLLLKDYKNAEENLKKAIAIDNTYDLPHYHLGVTYYRNFSENKPKNDKQPIPQANLKYLDMAIKEMQTAVKMNPDLAIAKESIYILSPAYQDELQKWKDKTVQKIETQIKKEDLKDSAAMALGIIAELKIAMIERINEDRSKFGLKPVKDDEIASKIGEINAKEQQKFKFVGHQSVDGSNPYYRYSQIGGNDYHAQNTAGRWGYNLKSVDYKQVLEWILDSHYRMVSEVPPHDGHRKNILDPYRNYVGIGISYSNKDCYLTQEFLNRYINFDSKITKKIKLGKEFNVSGAPVKGYKVAGTTIFYEPFFKNLTPEEINDIPNYSLPSTRLDLYKKLPEGYKYGNGSRGDIDLKDDGTFSIPFKQYKGKGIYTMIIWLMDEKDSKVFAASTISIAVQ